MKCAKLKIALILVIAYFSCETWGDLSVSGAQCGSKTCKPQEYCSQFDRLCRPCSDICNEQTHNYEPTTCASKCQDYLHDIRYVRKDGTSPPSSGKDKDLRGVVQRLQHMVTVTLTLTCFTLLVLVVIVTIQICKWKKNNHITISSLRSKFCSKKSAGNKSSGNGVTVPGQISGKPDLRLDMPTPGSVSDNSPVTVTTNISRRPAEDTALDYAYDNHAMSSSPSPNIKPHESNF